MDNNKTMENRINLEKQNKQNDQVTELILDNCRASQISGLTDDFVNLETLSLINVGLVTLKGFPKLPKLKKLELSDNRLTGGLNLLHGSPKLQHLNISGNRIKDLEALEPLKEFHDLVNLDLYNCEVTKSDDYRQKVFELLPNLHSLDGYDRNEREVADSDESDDEGSDVENRITRDDNDLDDEVDDEEDGDSSEFEDEEGYHATPYDEEAEDDDDDDDDDGQDFDEEDDDEDDEDDDEEEDIGQDSSVELTGASAANAASSEDPTRDGDDSNVQEVGENENGDDEDDDDDEEDGEIGSDLKQLQKDNIDEEDSEDDDFEPSNEVDDRDHEIDPEDDGDEDIEEETEAQLSTSKEPVVTSGADASNKARGQKRKHEDEGGDEVED